MKNNKVRFYLTISFILLHCFDILSQESDSYLPAKTFKNYQFALRDTLEYEIILPRENEMGPNIPRPVIFIFDRQNKFNYQYQLQTISYLTSIGAMPPSVIVGVSFPAESRTLWTIPNQERGLADSLVSFLLGSLLEKVNKLCPLSGFTVLSGHSRTAMLAQYALMSTKHKVNAVIAASNSFFDFGTRSQQTLFEQYCSELSLAGLPRFFFFSSGSTIHGDLHELSVNQLFSFLDSIQLPKRFTWRYYHEPAAHMTTPGLTMNRALNELFSPLNRALQESFDLLNSPIQTDSIPWSQYMGIWESAASQIGGSFPPTLTFFNSLASGYLNDYKGEYKKVKYIFAMEVLRKAMTYYPFYPGFYSFYAYICLENGDKTAASIWNKKAKQVLKQLRGTTRMFREEEEIAIKEVEAALGNSN